VARSDNIRADIERISTMPDAEFEARWGAWAHKRDRDLSLMRQRWLGDLERALPFAEREEAAVAELIAAKVACTDEPSATNRARKATAVAAVQAARAEERTGRTTFVAGDAYATGV